MKDKTKDINVDRSECIVLQQFGVHHSLTVLQLAVVLHLEEQLLPKTSLEVIFIRPFF